MIEIVEKSRLKSLITEKKWSKIISMLILRTTYLIADVRNSWEGLSRKRLSEL